MGCGARFTDLRRGAWSASHRVVRAHTPSGEREHAFDVYEREAATAEVKPGARSASRCVPPLPLRAPTPHERDGRRREKACQTTVPSKGVA